MKNAITLALIIACASLAACGSKDDASQQPAKPKVGASVPANGKAITSQAVKPEDAPRAATYDPNLKPAQIVWDSPEKQKAWEARQAELKKSPSQPAK